MQDYSPGPCLLEGGCVASIVTETHVVGTSCLKWRYAVECQIDWRCSAPCRFSYHRQWIWPGTRKKPIVTYRSRDHLFTHSYAIANTFPRDSIISFIRTLSSLDLCNRLAGRCGVLATQIVIRTSLPQHIDFSEFRDRSAPAASLSWASDGLGRLWRGWWIDELRRRLQRGVSTGGKLH